MLRKIYVYVNLLTLMLFIPVTILWAQQSQAKPECEVQITNPDRNGVNVGIEMDVKGTAIIPSGNHLWVLAHRTKGFKTVWWPQGEGEIDPKTHVWEVTVTFGGPQDIGYEFEIAVITVNEQGHSKLQDYRNKAMASGDWRPIAMPPTTSAPVIRSVKKVTH